LPKKQKDDPHSPGILSPLYTGFLIDTPYKALPEGKREIVKKKKMSAMPTSQLPTHRAYAALY